MQLYNTVSLVLGKTCAKTWARTVFSNATARHCDNATLRYYGFCDTVKYKNVRPTDPKWSLNIVLKGNATGNNFGGKK